MADPYRIPRINRPFQASVKLPGSKSIALRQLVISALASGTSTLEGVPVCDDTAAMLECLTRLGLEVAAQDSTVTVGGNMNLTDDVVLDARMSGASTRLLLGLAALRTGSTLIDGHASLQARTNAPLLDTLQYYGCQVDSPSGGLPTRIRGPLQTNGTLTVDGSISSQYITALLLIAPYLHGATSLEISGELVSRPYIDITIAEMAKRGILAQWQGADALHVTGGRYTSGAVTIEGDATAATYFSALATVHGSRVTLENLGADTQQGDYAFCDVMAQLGATVESTPSSTTIQGPPELECVSAHGAPTDMQSLPDAALTLIAMAPLLGTPVRLSGLSTLHHKECDRLACPVAEFAKMGISATADEGSITIEPIDPSDIRAHTLSTYHDHRMAMAFSVLGSVTGTLTVDDAAVVNKTYPSYWSDYEGLLTSSA